MPIFNGFENIVENDAFKPLSIILCVDSFKYKYLMKTMNILLKRKCQF